MQRLLATLSIGLLACGGSSPKEPVSAADTGGTPAEAAPDQPAATPDSGGDGAPANDNKRPPSDAGKFAVDDADRSKRPEQAKLEATETEAAVRFFVVDKDNGPIEGIVISLTSPSGDKYYTGETDAEGFGEVLVPVGKTYDLVFLSLGRRNVAAQVDVADKPHLNLKLTMRYKRIEYVKPFVLGDVQFQHGKAALTPESLTHLDALVEYMTHKKSIRIEISGHTDNVGKKRANKKLSQKRANAVRDYLVSQGIAKNRLEAVGYGDEKPIGSNDTSQGRQQNRRIEATELD